MYEGGCEVCRDDGYTHARARARGRTHTVNSAKVIDFIGTRLLSVQPDTRCPRSAEFTQVQFTLPLSNQEENLIPLRIPFPQLQLPPINSQIIWKPLGSAPVRRPI